MRRRRIPGGRAPRLVLTLALLAGALGTVVARSEPASAWSIRHNPDEVVITSERLHDETVRATLVLTLRRDGDVVFRAHEVHNSGATRKFYRAEAEVSIPGADFSVSTMVPDGYGLIRIASDSTRSQETRIYSQDLFDRWDRVSTHAVEASLKLDVRRTQVQ